MVNNYDWFGSISFIDFLRDIGKYFTVNYMMSKESVKKRIETGISYTEFAYQIMQGYDFYVLNQEHNVTLQIGGLHSGVKGARKRPSPIDETSRYVWTC